MLGDNVAVLRQDQTWLILGKTTSAESTDPGPVLQAGEVVMTVTAATGATANVVFARPFTRIPAVATNLASGAGPTNGWVSRAFAITTTGFTMFIFGASSTFTTAVQWQAQEYTQ